MPAPGLRFAKSHFEILPQPLSGFGICGPEIAAQFLEAVDRSLLGYLGLAIRGTFLAKSASARKIRDFSGPGPGRSWALGARRLSARNFSGQEKFFLKKKISENFFSGNRAAEKFFYFSDFLFFIF